MNKRCHTKLTLLALVALSSTAHAGVRHSRSINGTGQPIPRVPNNIPSSNDPNLNQGIPVQIPGQVPLQAPNQPQGIQQLPAQIPAPMPIPPPMPVQIPNQPNGSDGTQMSVQPSVQAPVQVPPATPVAPPMPVGVPTTPAENSGQSQQYIQPQTPIVIPPPMQVQVPSQLQSNPQQATPSQVPQNPNMADQKQNLPYQMPQQDLPGTPIQPPGQKQFFPSQQLAPSGDSNAPLVQPFQQSSQPLPMQGQPSLPPAPPGAAGGTRYLFPTYGMAGCGLGSMVFNKNTRSEQWLASVINDAFIPQSLPISTGTSNCVDVDEEQTQAEQEIFIDTNFHALRVDAARGDGESLRAYAELMGCYKEGLFDTFASLSQGQFQQIFSDSQPRSVAERYRDALKRSRALKTRCDRLF